MRVESTQRGPVVATTQTKMTTTTERVIKCVRIAHGMKRTTAENKKQTLRIKVLASQSTSFATFEYTFRLAIRREANALIGNAGNSTFSYSDCVRASVCVFCTDVTTTQTCRVRALSATPTHTRCGATANNGIKQGTVDGCEQQRSSSIMRARWNRLRDDYSAGVRIRLRVCVSVWIAFLRAELKSIGSGVGCCVQPCFTRRRSGRTCVCVLLTLKRKGKNTFIQQLKRIAPIVCSVSVWFDVQRIVCAPLVFSRSIHFVFYATGDCRKRFCFPLWLRGDIENYPKKKKNKTKLLFNFSFSLSSLALYPPNLYLSLRWLCKLTKFRFDETTENKSEN